MVLRFELRPSVADPGRVVGTVGFRRFPNSPTRAHGLIALTPEEVDALRTLSFADGESTVELVVQED